jgi:hypothetical protein
MSLEIAILAEDGSPTDTEAHHGIRWCALDDLDKLSPPMPDGVKWYCRKAIQEISDWRLPIADAASAFSNPQPAIEN